MLMLGSAEGGKYGCSKRVAAPPDLFALGVSPRSARGVPGAWAISPVSPLPSRGRTEFHHCDGMTAPDLPETCEGVEGSAEPHSPARRR